MNSPSLPLDIGIIVLALSAGWIHGWYYSRAGFSVSGRIELSKAARLWGLPLLGILVVRIGGVMLFRPAIAWRMPLVLEFYAVPLLWAITFFCIIFILTSIIAMACCDGHRLRWILVLTAPVLIAGMEAVSQSAVWTEGRPELWSRVSDEGIILQSSGVTCGAAACANAVNWFGGKSTEQDMADLLGTSRKGTTTAQMVYALHTVWASMRVSAPCRWKPSRAFVRPPLFSSAAATIWTAM